jgi:hypothetical protein
MDQKTADKIVYWQNMQAEASKMLTFWLMSSPVTVAYYGADDCAYIVAWQKRHALCYREIQRHRGF